MMTDYSFRSYRLAQPEPIHEDAFTRRLRRKVAERRAERKALLDRIRAQRALDELTPLLIQRRSKVDMVMEEFYKRLP